MAKAVKENEYKLVRIRHVDTENSIRRITHGSDQEIDEDESQGNVFCLEFTKDCLLGAEEFRGSVLDCKLPNMFFKGAVLEANFKDDYLTITVRGTMDCKINGQELEEDIPFRLNYGDVNALRIDDEDYAMAYLKKGAYSRRGPRKEKSASVD